MSLPLTPLSRWLSGTNQNSTPANDNSLRVEIFNTDGIADDVTAQPGSPNDGDWYIIPNGATGTQWATFAEDSIAIFYGGAWYEFVPADGNIVSVDGAPVVFASGSWSPYIAPSAATWGAIVGDPFDQTDSQRYTIVTEASSITATVGTHDGMTRYNRCADDVTFDSGQPYVAGMVFNIRATAGLDLVESGVTLTPTYGGTLELESGMGVQVVMTSATTADVNGLTVPSP